jgi:hypothetical protein
MPNTYTLLETITVGAAGASSVTFNSIPQTGYTDLVVKMSARSVTDTPACIALVQFNADTGSNYSYKYARGTGSAVDSSGASPTTGINLFIIAASNATASTFGNSEMYIPNYRSANYKSVSLDAVSENNATRADAVLSAGLWSSTAAITSIKLSEGAGNFAQHSTFSLYGVSALGTTPTKAPKATGGDIIMTDGTYWIHTFLSSGTFTPATALTCDVLVVAGGGGGGAASNGSIGGGGGAGGYRTSSFSITSASNVTVGAGGAGGGSGPLSGSPGNDSVFSTITSTGGGFGGKGDGSGTGASGGNGGSGGGAGFSGLTTTVGGTGNTPSTSPSQGNNGGNEGSGGGGAGGGGASSAGGNPTAGSGTANSISGSSVTYSSGGSGSGSAGSGVTPAGATPNTGTGGEAGWNAGGGAGGSGVVIIRYLAA